VTDALKSANPTVLVLGAGRAIVRSVAGLKAAGFRTVVADSIPQPHAFEVADVGSPCAVHDVDGLARLIEEHGIDGAVATNEAGVSAIAHLAQQDLVRGLPLPTAARLASKLEQRQEINRLCPDWAVPFQIVQDVEDVIRAGEALGWPLILKPDLSGGGSRGVSLVSDREAAASALAFAQEAAAGSAVLAERALDGPQFSAEVLVAEGRAEVLAIGRKRKSRPPYRVDLGVSYPGLAGPDRALAEQMVKDVVRALGIENSPAHIEFAMTSAGPRPIEVGGRVGGGFTALLVGHSSGCDPFLQAARLACGLPVQWPEPDAGARGAVYGFLTYPPGQAAGFVIPEQVTADPRVLDAFIFLPPDGQIRPLRWTSQRVGMIAVTGVDADDAMRHFEAISKEMLLDYADGRRCAPLTNNAEEAC